MYSFQYDESETWSVWPNYLSLSEFTNGRSATIITYIFRSFCDGVRDKVNEIQTEILDRKSLLTKAVEKLRMTLFHYQMAVEVGDDFVR